MAVVVLNAVTRKGSGNLTVEGMSRNFKIIMDEQAHEGGDNNGMNPMEIMLCGLGGSLSIMAHAFAKKKGINLQDFWVEIQGDMDTDGFKGITNVKPGFLEIRYKIHIKSSSPSDEIKSLVDYIENKSPVQDTIANYIKIVLTDLIIEK